MAEESPDTGEMFKHKFNEMASDPSIDLDEVEQLLLRVEGLEMRRLSATAVAKAPRPNRRAGRGRRRKKPAADTDGSEAGIDAVDDA